MSRSLPSGFYTQAEASVFRPALLVEVDWPSGPVYAWTGYGSIAWDGKTFVGTGELGRISPITESGGGRANGISLELSGIPTAMIGEATENDTQGRTAKVWFCSMNSAGAFQVDPYLLFVGVVDVPMVRIGPETSTITVQLEKELIDRRSKERRYTDEDQRQLYPGDLFFDHVAGLATRELSWGGKTQSATPAASANQQIARQAAIATFKAF